MMNDENDSSIDDSSNDKKLATVGKNSSNDDGIDESIWDSDNEYVTSSNDTLTCKTKHVTGDESIVEYSDKEIIAMAIGIKDDAGAFIMDEKGDLMFLKYKYGHHFTPKFKDLVKEMKRRQTNQDIAIEDISKLVRNNSYDALYEYLQDHPINDANLRATIERRVQEIKTFLQNFPVFEEPVSDRSRRRLQLNLRLIHAMWEIPENRNAYIKGQNLFPYVKDFEKRQLIPYERIANTFNSPHFNPVSFQWGHLHETFAKDIPIDYEELKEFCTLTGVEVKKRMEGWYRMDLLSVTGRWEYVLDIDADISQIEATSCEHIRPSSVPKHKMMKCNYFDHEGLHILYLWEASIKFDMLYCLLQRLHRTVGASSAARVPRIFPDEKEREEQRQRTKREKKRKKQLEEYDRQHVEQHRELQRQLKRAAKS